MKRRGPGQPGQRLFCCSLLLLSVVGGTPPAVWGQGRPGAVAPDGVPVIRLTARAACADGRCLATAPVPLTSLPELTAQATVEQVLARSPTLAEMVAVWQAAEARYPQVTALDNPMFNRVMAPASAFSARSVSPTAWSCRRTFPGTANAVCAAKTPGPGRRRRQRRRGRPPAPRRECPRRLLRLLPRRPGAGGQCGGPPAPHRLQTDGQGASQSSARRPAGSRPGRPAGGRRNRPPSRATVHPEEDS